MGKILHNVRHEDYHRRVLGEASKSALDQIAKSPAHYEHWLAAGSQPTYDMVIGQALHCRVLEPERWDSLFAVKPDGMSFSKTDGKLWKAERDGLEIIKHDDALDIERMAESVLAHPVAGALFRGGRAEVTLRWQDEATGLQCKGRADYWRKDLRVAADLKSAADASWRGFQKACVNRRYHVQSAFYSMGFEACGEPLESFVFVAVDKTAPYLVAVYQLDAEAQEKGYSAAREDIDRLARCVADQSFPGYPETIQSLSLPAWA